MQRIESMKKTFPNFFILLIEFCSHEEAFSSGEHQDLEFILQTKVILEDANKAVNEDLASLRRVSRAREIEGINVNILLRFGMSCCYYDNYRHRGY